jgi:hypothetical protein
MKTLMAISLLFIASGARAEPLVQADTNRIISIATNAIAAQRTDLSITNLDLSKLTYFSDGKEFHDIFVEFRYRTPITIPEVDPETHDTTTNIRPEAVVVRMDQDGRVKNVSSPRQTRKLRLSEHLEYKKRDRSTKDSTLSTEAASSVRK